MTRHESMIIRAVLRYNGIADEDMPQHLALIVSNGTYLDRQAYANYRLIWNSFTDVQRCRLTAHRYRVTH